MNSCSFTGHRCDLLYGWNIDIKEYKVLAQIIAKHCRELIKKKNVIKFYTGGALGFDTVVFWTINYLKKEFPNIKNILCIPFEGYNKNWINKADIDRFKRMVLVADEIIYVNKMPGYETILVDENNITKKEVRDMLDMRNHFMVDESNFLIACWNEVKSRGTYKTIKYAKSNKKEIVYIRPKEVYMYI